MIEVTFGLGGPAWAPVLHRFSRWELSPHPSGEFFLAACGAEAIPITDPTPTTGGATLCPKCEALPRAEDRRYG